MTRRRMSVTIRGVTYPDAQTAARALKVKPATVYCALCRGDIERVGLGVNYRQRATKGGRPPKPVTVAGRSFASMADLARAIGRDPRSVRLSLRAGSTARQRIILAVIQITAAQDQAEFKRRMKSQDA